MPPVAHPLSLHDALPICTSARRRSAARPDRMNVLALWRKMQRWPAGAWIFSRAVCFKAPYFGTIHPRFEVLEAGRCEASIPDRSEEHTSELQSQSNLVCRQWLTLFPYTTLFRSARAPVGARPRGLTA